MDTWLNRVDCDLEDFIRAEHSARILKSWNDRVDSDKTFQRIIACGIVFCVVFIFSFVAFHWLLG